MGDAEKDLTSSRYRNVTIRCQYFVRDELADVCEHEKIERDREDERVDPQETSHFENQ